MVPAARSRTVACVTDSLRPSPRQRSNVGLWVVLGLGVPALAGLALVLQLVATAASYDRDTQAHAVGRSVVVDGTFTRAEVSGGLPVASGVYTLAIPDGAPVPGAGTGLVVHDGSHWGFPPSEQFPQTRSFLLVESGGRAVVAQSGPEGSIGQPTEQTLAAATRLAQTARAAVAVPAGAAGALAVVVPVLLVRRRRPRT